MQNNEIKFFVKNVVDHFKCKSDDQKDYCVVKAYHPGVRDKFIIGVCC